jgi:hypothetical protein
MPHLVASRDCLADPISRWPQDRGDYKLNPLVFTQIINCFKPYINPQIDMFASPGNKQLPLWVGRYPHHGAWDCNSLEMDLQNPLLLKGVYANPPWSVIPQWLQRLKDNPDLRCLIVVPLWVGCSWWPLLVKLHDKQCPILKITPQWGMFTNCLGEKMPPTRWHLLSHFIREMLQAKQVPPENIQRYLNSIRSLPRYSKAFKVLWAFIKNRGGPSCPNPAGHS